MSDSKEQKQGLNSVCFGKPAPGLIFEDIDSRYSISYRHVLSGLRIIHVPVEEVDNTD